VGVMDLFTIVSNLLQYCSVAQHPQALKGYGSEREREVESLTGIVLVFRPVCAVNLDFG